MVRANRPRLNAIESSSESIALTCPLTRPDRWSKLALRLRVEELVQKARLEEGAGLILESVTNRVTLPQPITIRVVLVPSTNDASLPPATVR